jgi:hypothetical protein
MQRRRLWLVILPAVALALTGTIWALGARLLPVLVLLGLFGLLVSLGALLARSKHFWMGGVLGAAIGAPLGWFMGGWDAAAVLAVALGLAGLMLRAFMSAVRGSGDVWKRSTYFDRELEEIAYFGNQPTGFFSTPAPPARNFQRKDSAAAYPRHDATGTAGAG